jgi:hypothetical protein
VINDSARCPIGQRAFILARTRSLSTDVDVRVPDDNTCRRPFRNQQEAEEKRYTGRWHRLAECCGLCGESSLLPDCRSWRDTPPRVWASLENRLRFDQRANRIKPAPRNAKLVPIHKVNRFFKNHGIFHILCRTMLDGAQLSLFANPPLWPPLDHRSKESR